MTAVKIFLIVISSLVLILLAGRVISYAVDYHPLNNNYNGYNYQKQQSGNQMEYPTDDTEDYHLIIDDNGLILLGSYPQTVVSNKTLINALNREKNNHGYFEDDLYSYVEYNGEKYAFIENDWVDDATLSDGRSVQQGVTYWFYVEPIKWCVIGESGGTYGDEILVERQLLSLFVLDGGRGNDINDKDDYNIYSTSYTKYFLDLFAESFSEKELQSIEWLTVGTHYNNYDYDNVGAYFYLLSNDEYRDAQYYYYDPNFYDLIGRPTDYALVKGVPTSSEGYAYWWLRNGSEYGTSRYAVGDYGKVESWYTGNYLGICPTCVASEYYDRKYY